MLTLELPKIELAWDPVKEEFLSLPECTLKLEHSLHSMDTWESKWKKPFLTSEKTNEETMDYVKCMALEPIDNAYYDCMTNETMQKIVDYIQDPMTATTITKQKQGKPSREIITSEIIYYWMTALNIPFECQYWNLNKLLTLVEVCSIKQSPPKKMSKSQLLAQNRSLNAARRAKHHSKG